MKGYATVSEWLLTPKEVPLRALSRANSPEECLPIGFRDSLKEWAKRGFFGAPKASSAFL